MGVTQETLELVVRGRTDPSLQKSGDDARRQIEQTQAASQRAEREAAASGAATARADAARDTSALLAAQQASAARINAANAALDRQAKETAASAAAAEQVVRYRSVYHGTNAPRFQAFNTQTAGEESKWGPGAYFAFSAAAAKSFGAANIYRAGLSIPNPYDARSALPEGTVGKLNEAALAIGRQGLPEGFESDRSASSVYNHLVKRNDYNKAAVREILEKAGYGGVVDTGEAVAFHPDQIAIKSIRTAEEGVLRVGRAAKEATAPVQGLGAEYAKAAAQAEGMAASAAAVSNAISLIPRPELTDPGKTFAYDIHRGDQIVGNLKGDLQNEGKSAHVDWLGTGEAGSLFLPGDESWKDERNKTFSGRDFREIGRRFAEFHPNVEHLEYERSGSTGGVEGRRVFLPLRHRERQQAAAEAQAAAPPPPPPPPVAPAAPPPPPEPDRSSAVGPARTVEEVIAEQQRRALAKDQELAKAAVRQARNGVVEGIEKETIAAWKRVQAADEKLFDQFLAQEKAEAAELAKATPAPAGIEPYETRTFDVAPRRPAREPTAQEMAAIEKSLHEELTAAELAAEERERLGSRGSPGATGGGPPRGPNGPRGSSGGLDNLKETFGRSAISTQLEKIIGGAGPIIGLTLGLQQLGQFADKLADLKKDWLDVNVSAGQMTEKIAGSLPVIGQFWQVGRKIHDLFSEDALFAERTKNDVEAINKATEAGARIAEARRQEANETHVAVRGIRDEANLIGVKGVARDQIALEQAHAAFAEDQRRQVRDKSDAAKRDVADAQEALNKAQAEAQTLEAQGPEARQTVQGPVYDDYSKRDEALARAKSLGNTYVRLKDNLDGLLKSYSGDAETKIVEDSKKTSKAIEDASRESGLAIASELRELAQKSAEGIAQVAQETAIRAGDLPRVLVADIDRQLGEQVGQIKAARDKRLAELKASGGKPVDLGLVTKIGQGFDDQVQAAQDHAQQERERVGREAAAQHAGVAAQINQGRIAAIDVELAGTNKIGEAERARLNIEDEFINRQKELNELLRTAAADQKAAVQAQLDALPALRQQAELIEHQNALRDASLAALDAQAAAGDKGAEFEARRAREAKSFAEEQSRARGLINAAHSPAERAAAEAALAGSREAQRRAAANTVRDASVQFLQQVAPGSHVAEVGLARYQVNKAFAEQADQLRKMLKDPGLTAAQKRETQTILDALPSAKRAALVAASGGGPLQATAGTELNLGGIHGNADAAREKSFLNFGKEQSVTNKLLADILKGIERLLPPTGGGGGIFPAGA